MPLRPDKWVDEDQRAASALPWWLNAVAVVLGGVVLLGISGVAAQAAGLDDGTLLVLLATIWFGPAPIILWLGHRKVPWPWWRNVLWLFVASPWFVGLGVIVALGGVSSF